MADADVRSGAAPARVARDHRLDSSLALLRDPYRFIGNRCRAFGTDLFEARLLFERTVCMSGPVAAELFYDADHFTRRDAAPEPLRATLFGSGGVQGLDGVAHRARKALTLALLGPARADALLVRSAQQWRRAAEAATGARSVPLYRFVQPLLMRAACGWAGIAVTPEEFASRCRDVVLLFDRAGSTGLGHLQARLARGRSERWLAAQVEALRALPEDEVRSAGHALATLALHVDPTGRRLPPRVAAVELLNLLRPIVAVSVFIVFAAHALLVQPYWRERLQHADDALLDAFALEVRRFYPFFPAVVARARHAFEWGGYRFRGGQRAMLDLYGTNHDPRSWRDPDRFDPERYRVRRPGPFDYVPQGGARAEDNHRCPGEPLTQKLVVQALRLLVDEIRWEPAGADLAIDMARLPALPRGGLPVRLLGLARAGR